MVLAGRFHLLARSPSRNHGLAMGLQGDSLNESWSSWGHIVNTLYDGEDQRAQRGRNRD